MNKTPNNSKLKIISKGFWIWFFKTPNSYFICFEEVTLSSLMKIIELLKFFGFENISKWNSNIFKNPFHLFKWKKSCHLLFRVLYLKRIWIHGVHKCKMKVWECPLFSLVQLSKSFEFTHFQSINQTINQNYLFVYNIPKFRLLGCYK